MEQVTEVLGKRQTLPSRLTACMRIIAKEMDATTAILYLLTPDRYLEVYALYDSYAPHEKKVRFRIGEGIVGFIAASQKSLICENIARHPNFLFRPGIADHINLALLGVPLISSRGTIGVLTLQNPLSKPFDQWREKGLTELGNFLARLEEFNRFPVINKSEGKITSSHTLQGVSFNPGIAIGTAFVHQPYSWKETDFAHDVRDEGARLKIAIRDMILAIDKLLESNADNDNETQEVLESYRMIASDRGWIRKMNEYIQKGFSAEAAVQKVRRHTRERFAEIGDPNLKNRLSDLEDLASRLLKHLSGHDSKTESLPESTILVAQNLGPAELLDYDRRFIKGLVLEEGVHTAHVAILARSLEIPVVGRIPLLLSQVETGDKLIIDGDQGSVILNPTPDNYDEATKAISLNKEKLALSKELSEKECKTLDNTHIKLTLNAGLPFDLHHLDDIHLEGVGLYRTEIPFMMRSSFPDVRTQTEIYRDIIDRAKDKPVTFRTLDIGGDKVLPYMWRIQDENPVLGWRAIRVALDKPAILRQQVRALIHASQGKSLNLLFPMISDICEYREAKDHVEHELTRAKRGKIIAPDPITYGVMLEVPSIVNQLEQLVTEVDFISVGTNDLFQFFYACDRTNPSMSNRYDVLSSPFLNYLKNICEICNKANVPTSLCGEMSSRPLEAMALLALGYRSLSITGAAAVPIKRMILSLPLQKTQEFILNELKNYSPSLRSALQDFAKEQQILV